VHRAAAERAQDQQVEGAGEEVGDVVSHRLSMGA
jgi:hypothetical protein